MERKHRDTNIVVLPLLDCGLIHIVLILFIIVQVLILTCNGQESVFITILNHRALQANNGPAFQCYQTTGASTLTFGRYIHTRDRSSHNLDPYQPQDHCCVNNAEIVTIPTSSRNGFGIFYCRGTEPNKATTTVPTVLLRSDAKLLPSSGFFTKTVNNGTTNVMLEVEHVSGDLTNDLIYWRFNDSIDGMSAGSLTHTISGPVSKANEGVYETFYANERSDGRHSIMRLIVRDCIAGRWGQPGCHGICDKCYNGGVCDDKSGKCICPPGFMDDNCLTACGGNKFGKTCEFQCSIKSPSDDKCRSNQYCLPDPYGCTCNTGFHHLDCETACPPNSFGAGCTQDCHCTGSCNIYTGACISPNICEDGWSGASCQIPDDCESDYYGSHCTNKCHCLNSVSCDKLTGECHLRQCSPGYNVYQGNVYCEACIGSTYGHECSEVCRCDVGSCNRVTGQCNGGCLNNWVQPDCQTGILSLTNTKVNPNQATIFTCVVTGDPTPSSESVIVQRIEGASNGVTFLSSAINGSSRSVVFDVDSVDAQEIITCRLRIQQEAFMSISSSTFVLPVMNSAPRVTISMGSLSASIEWDVWDGSVGDAPVIAYRVYYKTSESTSWITGQTTGIGLSTSVKNLRWETAYTFSIAAVRTGPGGEGPRGPSSIPRTTTCAEPLAPQGLKASTYLSAPKQIMLQWKEPDVNTIRCSKGITHFTIYYRATDDSSDLSVIAEPTMTSINITSLQIYTEYIMYMAMTNEVGMSVISNTVKYVSPEEEPPAPTPTITMTTLDSITVSLKTATPSNLNGVIKSYQVEYQKVSPTLGDKLLKIIVNVGFSVETVLQNLTENSNYSIRVKIENGAGSSLWSKSVFAMTVNMAINDAQIDSFGVIMGVLIAVIMILILLTVLIVFVIRRRKSRKKLPPISYMSSNYGHATYENAVIDLTVPDQNKNDYGDETVYANTNIVNIESYPDPPKSRLPMPDAKIPIATVKPTPAKQRVIPQPTEYENVKLLTPPIPVAQLERYIKEKKISGTDSLKDEYALIPKDKTKSWDIAAKPENKAKNRFKNIIAYDHSRVILEPIAGDPHSDYYNACYIQNHRGENSFIASQGPNSASLNDFWRMIWQEKVGTLVMVTQLVENGKEKCRQYWPDKEGHSEVYGNLEVTLLDSEIFSDYSIRTLNVQQVNGFDVRTIKQYSFFSWPDMGVPLYPTAVLQFLHSIKNEYNRQYTAMGAKSPILVHCSAGVGRTGTFISIFTQLEQIESHGQVDVFNFVRSMRDNRVNMVQTAEQYMFVYNSLLEAYLAGNTAIPANEYSERLQNLKQINSKTRHTFIEEEFKTLNSISPLPEREMYRGACLPENADKNRYPNVLPLERNRPFLMVEGTSESTNYINAAFVDSFKKKDAFITTQMPLPNTTSDIWRMSWDWKCSSIVMLNDFDESDHTCGKYWPDHHGSIAIASLVVDSLNTESTEYFVCRRLKLTNLNEPSSPVFVNQFHLRGWSANQDKPDSPLCLITLLDAVESWQHEATSKGPVIVHCMNGIGRSGVFCTIATVREKLKRDNVIDIFQAIKRLRMNHPQIVESLDQYVLCYETMQEFFKQFGDYANIR